MYNFDAVKFNPITSVANSEQRPIASPVNFWITLTGSGALSCTYDIVVSPDGDVNKEKSVLTAPQTLSGTTSVSDFSARCLVSGVFRVKISAISGTGATANVSAWG